MSSIQSFTFEDHGVRTMLRDEAPWFVLADVCRVLEIILPHRAADRLDEDEKAKIDMTRANATGGKINDLGLGSGNNEAWIVNESGLYSLILTSRKPAAKRFKKWVTAEVLPALRRTGMYVMDGVDEHMPLSADGKVFGMTLAKANAAARMMRVYNSNWGPEVARAMWQNDPTLPPVMSKSANRADIDLIGLFVSSCVSAAPGARVQASAMFEAYLSWSFINSKRSITQAKFGRVMGERFHKSEIGGRTFYHDCVLLNRFDRPEAASCAPQAERSA